MSGPTRPLGLILAGGQSKRLFPVETPKPLLKVNGKSLLEQAIGKLSGFDICVVSNAEISAAIRESFQRDSLPVPNFAIEPEGRDTAAAVGFGLRSVRDNPPDWVAVLSADQWMKSSEKFSDFLRVVDSEIKMHPEALFVAGSPASSKDVNSHSQFGWILPEKVKSGSKKSKSSAVRLFVEKPSGARLTDVRKRGGLVNAGMFFGRYETFVKAYEKWYPDVFNSTFRYADLKRTPIDRAIFENHEAVRVLPVSFQWEDLGTWADWARLVGKGQGSGGTKVNSKTVFISSDDEFDVYAFDCKDLCIVQSGKRVLVMPLSKSKDMKGYLEKL